SYRVERVGEQHFGPWYVGKRRQMVIAEARINDLAISADDHLLVKCSAERLRDTALDLSEALHRISDASGVCCLHALEDSDLTGALVHGDPEAMDVKGHRARRPARAAAAG